MIVTSTARSLVIEDLKYPSGRLALRQDEEVEIVRSHSTFYILRDGEIAWTTDDQGLIYRHLIVDVPLEDVPWSSW